MLDNFFFKTQSRSKQSCKFIIAFIFCLILLAKAPCCEAQYFGLGSGLGYSGYGSSLLYPLSYLFYGGNGTAPLYALGALGSGFANNAIYNTYRNVPYGNYPYSNNYPMSTGPNSNYPFNNNYNPNQYQAPAWNYSPNQTQPAPSNDPNDIFNSRSTVDPNSSYKAAPPAVAPNVLSQAYNNGMMPPSFVPDSRVLDGFFQTVNTRYKGNLFHALNQLDMQAWASSISLIQPGQQFGKVMSSARKSEVSTIMKDSSLNSQKKLEILRLLLASPQ